MKRKREPKTITIQQPKEVTLAKVGNGYMLYFPEKQLWSEAKVEVYLSVSTFKISAVFDSDPEDPKIPDVLEIDRSGA